MKKLFEETIRSVQDKTYGQEIVKRTVQNAIVYWLKYIAIFAIFYITVAIITATYEIPQLPKTIREHVPPGNLMSKGGKLSSTLTETKLINSPEFSLTIDPKAKVDDPNSLPYGITMTEDSLYFKSPDMGVKTLKFADLPEFDLSKEKVIAWLNDHKIMLWAITLAAILLFGLITAVLYSALQLISILLWSVVLWLGGKLFQKPLSYKNVLKLVLFASVPWLLLSNITGALSSTLLYWVNVGLFVYFVINWWRYLPPEFHTKKLHLKHPEQK